MLSSTEERTPPSHSVAAAGCLRPRRTGCARVIPTVIHRLFHHPGRAISTDQQGPSVCRDGSGSVSRPRISKTERLPLAVRQKAEPSYLRSLLRLTTARRRYAGASSEENVRSRRSPLPVSTASREERHFRSAAPAHGASRLAEVGQQAVDLRFAGSSFTHGLGGCTRYVP